MTQLVGAKEIGEALEVSVQRVHQWRALADFPEPVHHLAMGYLWAWPDVEAWARKTGRLKGE